MPVLAFLVFAASMIFVLSMGWAMSWAMVVGFFAFLCAGLRRGFSLKALLRMAAAGARNSLIVVRILLIIGVLTGLWRSAGTFAFLTAWGLRLIAPKFFVLAAFLLPCVLSYAIGTAFGTAGTLGVALMALARGGGVNELVTAGAIMSGIYFGDRCSPVSSCAHLVAAVTDTDLYSNIRLMMRTALLPFLLSLLFYLLLSLNNPMRGVDGSALAALETEFNLSPLAGLPALIMLVLPLMGVKVFPAFLASILCAFFCTVSVQGMDVFPALSCALLGYHVPGDIRALFHGGGLFSMLEISSIVVISGTYSGIFDGTGMLDGVQSRLEGLIARFGPFPVTALTGAAANAVFCNQTVGVMMTSQLIRQPYERQGITRPELAQDMANSVVVIAGLVPWCIACSVPLSMFGVSFRAIPYSVYLYLLPVCYALTRRPQR